MGTVALSECLILSPRLKFLGELPRQLCRLSEPSEPQMTSAGYLCFAPHLDPSAEENGARFKQHEVGKEEKSSGSTHHPGLETNPGSA